jgi:NPCBM/NEW2 domain
MRAAHGCRVSLLLVLALGLAAGCARSDEPVPQPVASAPATTAPPAAATPAPAVTPSVSAPAPTGSSVQYLSDLTPVELGAAFMGSADVNGTRLVHSIVMGVHPNRETNVAGYNLGRRYTTLQATVGLRDDSPSSCEVRMLVSIDGDRRDVGVVRLGVSKPITLDIANALRLELVSEYLGSDNGAQCPSVWGDAAVS